MKSIIIIVITLSLFINAGLGNNDEELDLGNLLQMGMQFGKQFLGEEGIEKIKNGDFSQVMDLGKQFLGEETVNDLLHAAADTVVQMKEKEKTEDDAPKDKVVDEL